MTFEQLHPDVIEALPDLKSYKAFAENGLIVEAWERREDGTWRDVTLREQELQRLQLATKKMQRELDRMNDEEVPDAQSSSL